MKLSVIVLAIILSQIVVSGQEIYKKIKVSGDIELIQLSPTVYVHVSYGHLPNSGRFGSNGLIFVNDGKAFLFDTPINDSLTMQLVSWIIDSMKLELTGFIPNHWHVDCLGGLGYLQKIGIKSYSNQLTIDIAKTNNLPLPSQGFSDSLIIETGDKKICCYFLGAAHSLDNVVVWLPSEKVLFPGCMAKDITARNMGNTVDGDLTEWPNTISKIITKFPDTKIVIPGHGQVGGIELLEHTLELLKR